MIIYALASDMKRSASESKPFQSRSKGEILGQARRKERLSRSKLKQVFLSDSDVELFMHLIQCIRLGLWKVQSLNQAFEVSKLWSMAEFISFDKFTLKNLANKSGYV